MTTISSIMDLTNAPTPPRWFEFLLEPGKLRQHLETPNCDPSPSQLIAFFFRNTPIIENGSNQSPDRKSTLTSVNSNGNTGLNSAPINSQIKEDLTNQSTANNESFSPPSDKLVEYSDLTEIHIPPDSYEAKYRAKKAYALQTLAIQVASFLKWDLNIICNNLPIPIQFKLMQALTNACSPGKCPPEVEQFAEIIASHWCIRSAITYQMSTLQPQSNNTTIIYLSQLQQQQQAADSSALTNMAEVLGPASKRLRASSTYLFDYITQLTQKPSHAPKRAKVQRHPFDTIKLLRPTIDCLDSRDEQLNDWSRSERFDSKEFIESACYDLGRFFFFEESYDLAKQVLENIKHTDGRFPHLHDYLKSATDLLRNDSAETELDSVDEEISKNPIAEQKKQTEKYLFDCMTEYNENQKKIADSDLRIKPQKPVEAPGWCAPDQGPIQQEHLLEAAKGDALMAQGNFKAAMGCFLATLMIMTDYFRFFSKSYVDEEPYITRMIQCSISLSCFTQAVALCQMTKSLNYAIAFKQLNERVCNDCCDDIYECIWNTTLLEYIINLHSRRGEIERRTKVIQLIGQLELNENNSEDILKEAEHVRRGRFFRILANKYM